MCPVLVRAQTGSVSVSLTAQSTDCSVANSCASLNIGQNVGGATLTLAGTWSGTLQFEAQGADGKTWVAISATPSNSTTTVTSATGNGTWQVNVSGYTAVRIRCSTFSTGTVNASVASSTASARGGGGGAGAVSSVFTRTGAVTATSGDYSLDQIGNPAASKAFALGANNLSFSASGVFNLTQINQNFLSTLTGGGACSPLSILNHGGTTYKTTDAIATCVNLPTDTSVTNAFTDGFAAYMQNPNANVTGQFGWVGAVGYYSQIWCTAAGAHCWGANFSSGDNPAAAGTSYGNEYDLGPQNTTSLGAGVIYEMQGTAQPTGDNYPANRTDALVPATAQFTTGYECSNGSVVNYCIRLGQILAGSGQNSQALIFNSTDNTPTAYTSTFQLNADNGNLYILGNKIILSNPAGGTTGDEALGIALKATVGLAADVLVKVDTANADSIVVCTTADTFCSGFTEGTNAATIGLCGTGVAYCGVVGSAGQKVQAIVGTGTCAIGNYVIIDTTTNGRVKCTATRPTTVNLVGYAMSVQGSVGSAVDVLTAFEPIPFNPAAPGAIGGSTPAAGTFTGLTFNGSTPSIALSGTTPYLAVPLIQTTQCSFSLTTSTLTLALSPVNLCTITLPNAAVVWRVNCQGGWSVPAGTTPTFAVGNNWAQTPSGVFAAANIDTTNAGVGLEGTTSSTANGNILATGALTTSATIFTTTWWTTFTGSATSGQYHPTASLTGTSATGTLVGFCTIQ